MGKRIFWFTFIASVLALCVVVLAERAFGNTSNIPGPGCCGYWQQSVGAWMRDAQSKGYGVYSTFTPEGKKTSGNISLWVEPSGEWAILASVKKVDVGTKKEGTWVCIIARGVDWRHHAHTSAAASGG